MKHKDTESESEQVRRIEVIAEASSIVKWRKQVVAGQTGGRSFAMISDEGEYMPGREATALTPLTCFIAGVVL